MSTTQCAPTELTTEELIIAIDRVNYKTIDSRSHVVTLTYDRNWNELISRLRTMQVNRDAEMVELLEWVLDSGYEQGPAGHNEKLEWIPEDGNPFTSAELLAAFRQSRTESAGEGGEI